MGECVFFFGGGGVWERERAREKLRERETGRDIGKGNRKDVLGKKI